MSECMHVDNLTLSILIPPFGVINPSGKWILSVIFPELVSIVDSAVLFLLLSFFLEGGETSTIQGRDRNRSDC